MLQLDFNRNQFNTQKSNLLNNQMYNGEDN